MTPQCVQAAGWHGWGRRFVWPCVVLIMAGLGAGAAHAVPRRQPVRYTYYLHGTDQIGEEESFPDLPGAGSGFLSMSTSPPSATTKSHEITNAVVAPTTCPSNNAYPVWRGRLHGTVIGAITAVVPVIATAGASVVVDLFIDASGSCSGGGSATLGASGAATLPVGQSTFTITLPNARGLTATENIELEIRPAVLVSSPSQAYGPWAARVFYDSSSDPAKITFQCVPASGRSC